MKKLILLFLLLFSAGLFAQNLSEGFESWEPSDWTIIQGPCSPTNNILQTSFYHNTGNFSAKFRSAVSCISGYDQYLITPQLNVTTGDQTISFYYIKTEESATEVFRIGWSSSGIDVNSDFTWGSSISDATTSWQQFLKTDLPAGTKHVVIHYQSIHQESLCIDDVSGPLLYSDPTITAPFCESFDDPLFPPNGWTNLNTAGTSTPGTWEGVTSGTYPSCSPHTGAGMSKYNCYAYSAGTQGILVTPPINLPNDNYKVSFWIYRDDLSAYQYQLNPDLINIYYNTDPNTTGATLLGTIKRSIYLDPIISLGGWNLYEIDMPVGSGGLGRHLIFEGVSAYGNNIFLDDVSVEEQTTNPLSCALNINPINASINKSITTILNWSYGGGSIAGYFLNFGTEHTPFNLITGDNLGNVYSYDPGTLEYGTTYYWQIIPHNGNGNATGCPIWSFTTEGELNPTPWWQTIAGTHVVNDYTIYSINLYEDFSYNFSLCELDDVGASYTGVGGGDGDITLFSDAGLTTEVWNIDGATSCNWNASTIGTVYENFSPINTQTYYLAVDNYSSNFGGDYTMAYQGNYIPLIISDICETTSVPDFPADTGIYYQVFLNKDLNYNFSTCSQDICPGDAPNNDADLTLYDTDGTKVWYIDGLLGCEFDASTYGDPDYEDYKPPTKGFYYLYVSDYYDYNPGMGINLAHLHSGCVTPFELPFSETFNFSMFPVCWSQTSTLNDIWEISTSSSAGGESFEMKASWTNGGGVSRLISPVINLGGLTSPQLSFKHFYNDFGPGVTLGLQTSTDGGSTWITEWEFQSGTGSISPETIELTLSNFNSNTLIAWFIDGDHYQFNNWHIDDIYINICESVSSFPFIEDFESGTVPPNCWTQVIRDLTSTWEAGPGYAQCIHWQTQDEWLISPSFDFSLIGIPSLSFDWKTMYYWMVQPNDNGDIYCRISTDNGGTWTTLWSEDEEAPFDHIFYTKTIDLGAYAGESNVMFAFQYVVPDTYAEAIYIDNFIIEDLTSGNGPKTTISSPVFCYGDQILVPITVLDFLNVGGISLTLNYDPAMLTYVGVDLNPLISSALTFLPSTSEFRLAWTEGTGINLDDDDILFTLEFDYIGPPTGGTTGLTWPDTPPELNEYSDPLGNAYPRTPFGNYFIDGSVTIQEQPTIEAGPDQYVCADVIAVTMAGYSFTGATGADWSGGSGTWVGDVYTPTAGEIASGSVVLTYTTNTADPCPEISDDMTVNFWPLPVLSSVSMQASTGSAGPPWDYLVSGDLSPGYSMCIIPSVANYYLDINALTSSPALGVGILNPFFLSGTYPQSFFDYWDLKGVDGGGPYGDWRDQMWLIINGNAPFFYIKLSGGDYKLVDGLMYDQIGGEPVLTVPGDYPPDTYTYTGDITDINGCVSLPIFIDMSFNNCDITGTLMYNNTAQTGLNNMIVTLNSTPAISATTDAIGAYTLSPVPSGTLTLTVNDNGKTTGGINSTDAAVANHWSVAPWNIEKVRFFAGDVDNNSFVLAGDAQQILAYFVNAGNPPYNFTPDWKFWLTGDMINANPYLGPANPSVTILSTSTTQDLYGLCTGDFNQSFTPGTTKSESESLTLEYVESISVASGDVFELPIYTGSNIDVGAISLILNLPADLIEVLDVYLGENSNATILHSFINNELRIGWTSLTPVYLSKGETMLTLKLKLINPTGDDGIVPMLADDPLNELANGNYQVINDAVIGVDVINTSLLGMFANNISDNLELENHPNPFNESTTFTYNTPVNGKVTLEIYDILSNKVKVLVEEMKEAGSHKITLRSGVLSPGVYMATLKLNNKTILMTRHIKIISN